MTTNEMWTPTDQVYRNGVPLNAGQLVGGIRLDNDTSSRVVKDVDWSQPVDTDDNVQHATAAATTHYHYQKISHLLLSDHIVIDARNVPEQLKQIAQQFARQNAKEVEAWGRYMKQRGGAGQIPEEQREYYHLLFQQQDVLPVLLGMQTINLAADVSYEEFYRNADPVFGKLASGFTEDNQRLYDEIRDMFRDIIQPMPLEDRVKLLQNVAQQVDLCQIIYRKREDDIFNPMGSDERIAEQQAGNRIKKFYKEIGLTENIF